MKYVYEGPTMLVVGKEEFSLVSGFEVEADIRNGVGEVHSVSYDDGVYPVEPAIEISAGYLKPLKVKPISFESFIGDDDGVSDWLLKKIRERRAKVEMEYNDLHIGESSFEPSGEALGMIRKAAREANDGHEVGGTHYRSAIEPWDFIYANGIPFDEACVIKYVCRHKGKNGAEDIKKAISYCEHILKTQYGVDED